MGLVWVRVSVSSTEYTHALTPELSCPSQKQGEKTDLNQLKIKIKSDKSSQIADHFFPLATCTFEVSPLRMVTL
jgi:hypothetical protein